MKSPLVVSVAVCAAASAALIFAARPVAFTSDTVFTGSNLAGWHAEGAASWKAANGEITGSASGNPGWLASDKSLQDLGFFASFRCSEPCDAGVLVRAQKTSTGMKGIYVSLKTGELGTYKVTWDAQGKELTREALRPANGQYRTAPAPTPAGAGRGAGAQQVFPAGASGAAGRGGRGGPPRAAVNMGDWNTIQIVLNADIVRVTLNGAGIGGGATDDQSAGFGPMTLRVGAGEVHFKDVSYTDLGLHTTPKEEVSKHFTMQRLSDFYYSWSAAAADFNHDGINDIVAGPYIYFGPDYQKSREIYLGQVVAASTEYPDASMMQFAYDFTGDGWPDVLTIGAIGTPATLFVNPKGEARRWDSYPVVPRILKEVAVMKDVDGDGKPELVYGGQSIQYAKPDPANPTGPWIIHNVGGVGSGHGLGVGDINGDKRMDIVEANGWWEQPADPSQPWIQHQVAFGQGAEIGVYDVNGDGLNDVVTSLNAHGYGLAWYEQKRDASGAISFVQHMIMTGPDGENAGNVVFSEPHGTAFADIDGDGITDFIVGKRFWSHKESTTDSDPNGPGVLYWYRTVRNPKAPGGAEFVPELIHNRSGAGNTLFAGDINKDGATDVLTSTDRGTFVFWGQKKAAAKK